MTDKKLFTFAISLSVLDHLGRNLYRSFATVLGEAISNSWDANANNVWIYIDKEKNTLLIKDDGDGMTFDDFQNKFLKIGYSKRKKGEHTSAKGRPYIGRKGIGKLALLSCSDRISVISKIKNGEYIGGIIDNAGLDRAITEDLIPSEYPLEKFDLTLFGKQIENHEKGTIIYFENIKEGVKNSLEHLKKIIALYFRFSLLDRSFNIHLNNEKITLNDLNDLAQNTEFLWNINSLVDPYITEKISTLKEPEKKLTMEGDIKGFVASVKKPRNLKITNTDEKVGVDLFVNGRLRERDILKHIPTDRIAISYLYGQIHVNGLDDEKDRFTSSREGIVADDDKYKKFLENLRTKLGEILEDWDKWRIKNRQEGDPENERLSKKDRSSIGLFNAVSDDFIVSTDKPEELTGSEKKKVEGWVDEIGNYATLNFSSYAECFISENLVRKHIQEKKINLSNEAQTEIGKWKEKETQNKNASNVNIEIRKAPNETSYLSMDHLANLVDKSTDTNKQPGLSRDAKEYKPIRDALMHTALLTDDAKNKLITIRVNIKGRVKDLLSGK
ncbi:DNA mismatch repair protein [Candidatus Woesearchaeota archaeon CG10_big_fil_rev_8_21_14_0_10_37_12]|nr:MAG: DNA mismatch repair protein [Candidatus Woesearchaeota archaeon CG10_big_fil_rev_8_21_14_0_10_37_12]